MTCPSLECYRTDDGWEFRCGNTPVIPGKRCTGREWDMLVSVPPAWDALNDITLGIEKLMRQHLCGKEG